LGSPALSELETHYPFTPHSRKFFEAIPVEEGLASREVLEHVEERLMNAIGRRGYEPHLSELIEFSSFFVAALVAGQDPFLTAKFGKKEAERSKTYFTKETPASKTRILADCFGLPVSVIQSDGPRPSFSAEFEDYLLLTSKYELTKLPTWKLSRQALQGGLVYISDNLLNDLFADASERAIVDGTRNLRRGAFPKQLAEIRERVLQFVPTPKPRSGKGYAYVEELLKYPVSDGRHRLVWMVLAPYLVNVKKVGDEEAIERIRSFVSAAGYNSDMRRFVEYNVKRSRRNGLMPPTFSTLRQEHSDIYSLLPQQVILSQTSTKPNRGAKAA
jgi:Primase X